MPTLVLMSELLLTPPPSYPLTRMQPSNGTLCNQELGRWISPFRRRIGRWLTPVHSFLPLLTPPVGQAQATCQFTMKTVPWAMPWVPSLSIRCVATHISAVATCPRLRCPDPAVMRAVTCCCGLWSCCAQVLRPRARGPRAHVVHPAISRWNIQLELQRPHVRTARVLGLATTPRDTQSLGRWCRRPIVFATPPSARRVELVAVITGHGDDNNGCGEFCVTSHHFVVNGKPHMIKFHYAGTPLGCADRVRTGVEPNEHGARAECGSPPPFLLVPIGYPLTVRTLTVCTPT